MQLQQIEQQLIDRVVSGDTRAFAGIVDRHKDKAMTLAVRLLRNREEAEEALQDAFVRAYKGLVAFNRNASFSTWLYRIVYNVCLTRIAKRRHSAGHISLEDQTEEMYHNETPLQEIDSKDRAEFISKAIDTLPQHLSIPVTLFYVQELSYDEISEVTGMPLGTVKTNLHRSRKILAEKLTRLGIVPNEERKTS